MQISPSYHSLTIHRKSHIVEVIKALLTLCHAPFSGISGGGNLNQARLESPQHFDCFPSSGEVKKWQKALNLSGENRYQSVSVKYSFPDSFDLSFSIFLSLLAVSILSHIL